MTISIITPVHNCSELAPAYEHAARGADQVIIVDNASQDDHADNWYLAAEHLQGILLRNEVNAWYCGACNQGYSASVGDLVIFMDSDVRATGDWLSTLDRCVEDGAIYGCKREMRVLAGQPIVYLDGFMLAARRSTWHRISLAHGPWDDDAFQGMYWMDVELCYRATRAGIALRTLPLPLEHLSNYTAKRTEGAYARTDSHGGDGSHKRVVEERVRTARRRPAISVNGKALAEAIAPYLADDLRRGRALS